MILPALVGAAAVGGAIALYGQARRRSFANALHAKLEAARVPTAVHTYTSAELHGLPAPVQRYFRTVLKEGQPLVWEATLKQTGALMIGNAHARWRPFTATQRVIAYRPGFDWSARVAMAPGLVVDVHDAYIAGEGLLDATLCGLIPLASQRGTPAAAQAELVRFLAEAAWYPTALLPSQGVAWTPVDDACAQATLRDGPHAVTLVFRFDAGGLVASVHAQARARIVAGRTLPTPWEGRCSHYAERDGMMVPTQGEAIWLLPDGPSPYWRGTVTQFRYTFAR